MSNVQCPMSGHLKKKPVSRGQSLQRETDIGPWTLDIGLWTSDLIFDLVKRALLWFLIGTPTEEFCAMAKAATGEMIILNFDDQFRF